VKVSIFHNITEEDGRLAIFSRTGDRRVKSGDQLQYVGALDFTDVDLVTEAANLAFEAGNSPADIDSVKEYRSWQVRSLCVGDVLAIESYGTFRERAHVTTLDCRPDGWAVSNLADFNLSGAAIVSLHVENAYELYDDVEYEINDVVVPTPPSDVDSDEFAEWVQNHIIDPYTGVGHEDGDSWYDVKVTASSDPALVGRKFDWGY